ncbi:MAG: DUF2461 domain-containing protein [Roseivirga sp.]|nr:DUF2461 domain-containing protein [Roseivirga sp.]
MLKKSHAYLLKLSKNNNREWFHDHKQEYTEAKEEFVHFTQQLIDGMSDFENLGDLKAKDCIYRIQRDVRFSPNKTPYNTHFSAMIALQGRKTRLAPYYFRLKPDGESLVAGGVWEGKAAMINTIREEIDYNMGAFKAILEAPAFVQFFKSMEGNQLKRPPKGYPPDHPQIDLLRHKQFLVFHHYPHRQALKRNFSDYLLEAFRSMKPFLDFLNAPLRDYHGLD